MSEPAYRIDDTTEALEVAEQEEYVDRLEVLLGREIIRFRDPLKEHREKKEELRTEFPNCYLTELPEEFFTRLRKIETEWQEQYLDGNSVRYVYRMLGFDELKVGNIFYDAITDRDLYSGEWKVTHYQVDADKFTEWVKGLECWKNNFEKKKDNGENKKLVWYSTAFVDGLIGGGGLMAGEYMLAAAGIGLATLFGAILTQVPNWRNTKQPDYVKTISQGTEEEPHGALMSAARTALLPGVEQRLLTE